MKEACGGVRYLLYIFHKILTVSPLYVNSKALGLKTY